MDAQVSLVQHGRIDELHAAIERNNSDAVQRLLDNHAFLEAMFIHQFEYEDNVQKDVTRTYSVSEWSSKSNSLIFNTFISTKTPLN